MMYGYVYHPAVYGGYQRSGGPEESFTDRNRFTQMVLKAVFDERKAQAVYRVLHDRAETPFQKRMIRGTLEDERKHERMVTDMYHTLTGQHPQVPHPQPAEVADFQNTIRQSFEDEIEAAEYYRTMYLMTTLPWLRDRLFEIMTDKMQHASRFAYLRAEL